MDKKCPTIDWSIQSHYTVSKKTKITFYRQNNASLVFHLIELNYFRQTDAMKNWNEFNKRIQLNQCWLKVQYLIISMLVLNGNEIQRLKGTIKNVHNVRDGHYPCTYVLSLYSWSFGICICLEIKSFDHRIIIEIILGNFQCPIYLNWLGFVQKIILYFYLKTKKNDFDVVSRFKDVTFWLLNLATIVTPKKIGLCTVILLTWFSVTLFNNFFLCKMHMKNGYLDERPFSSKCLFK